MENAANDDGLKQELERMRARLLDLSARNPLLNYSHPRASSLRIVDEVPALVLESLLTNGGFKFAPLDAESAPSPVRSRQRRAFGRPDSADLFDPNASAPESDDPALQSQSDRERREAAKAARAQREMQIKELATTLGIDPSYDLPALADSEAKQHGDGSLQTLLTPDELEARLQKVQSAAVTAIQESGANMLHLLFGFVEWTDVAAGKVRHAPLVLLPVTLSRLDLDFATHTYPYKVAASGEDWSTNVTLMEKCRREFGLILPSINDEENLEDYFARIEDVLQSAPPGWRVCRQLTLGLVSFGKILMWRDLDPGMWPATRPMLANTLLREVLGADDATDGEDDGTHETRTTEYNIDELPDGCGPVPPIVVPADSSQHSVLIDVQRGDNLVVQGPPGTGKSQTISNIIAGAIAAGKRVLFVAEKKAALDVVANRLADAGLGPFCLPLHSHTSNKREFLDGLKVRIDLANLGNAGAEIEMIEGLLGETRADLTGHAKRLHEPFGSLGDTAYSIFWRTRRLGSEMPKDAMSTLSTASVLDAAAVTPRDVARNRAALAGLAAAHLAALADTPSDAPHPWHGVTSPDIGFDQAQALVALAQKLRGALVDASRRLGELKDSTPGVQWPDALGALHPVLARCAALTAPDSSVSSALIESIQQHAGVAAVQRAVEAADLARHTWDQVWGPWSVPGAISEPTVQLHAARLQRAMSAFGESRSVAFIAQAEAALAVAASHLEAAERLSTAIATTFGVATPLTAGLALRLIDVVMAAEQLPEGALALRSPALAAPGAVDRIATLATKASALSAAGDKVDALFDPALRPTLPELRTLNDALTGATWFFPTLFSGSYRSAVKKYRAMTGGRRVNRKTMTADVGTIVRHVTTLEAFVADTSLAQLFGHAADGINSPFAAATAVLGWTKNAVAAFRGDRELGVPFSEAVWNATPSVWSNAAAHTIAAPDDVGSARAVRAAMENIAGMVQAPLRHWDASDFRSIRQDVREWHVVASEGRAVINAAGAGATQRVTDVVELLSRLIAAWAADANLTAHARTFQAMGMGVPRTNIDVDTNHDALVAVRAALTYLSQFQAPGLPTGLAAWLSGGVQHERIATVRAGTKALSQSIEAADNVESEFAVAGDVNVYEWYRGLPNGITLDHRIARFDRAIANAGSLSRFVSRLRAQAVVNDGPLPIASELLASKRVPPQQLPDVYDFVVARTLSELVLRARPELDQFSGDLHETRRAQFAALDERFISLTQERIAQLANRTPRIKGVGYGPVKDLTEQSLIEHEIEKTRRHIPIREMFKRAGRAIQSLKPCIMMGPQSVAQYLPPGLFQFDLVVMDEASQMRPEDALGAIARGAQLVVVGDPKQLGPSSFFDTQASDDDELEEAAAVLAAEATAREVPRGASVLERSESILLAAARRYPLRMLRWHYRSKYPELIAFSNEEFYANDLVLFPHPGTERPGDGLNFQPVENALYSASVNPKEAQDVVAAVQRHAVECPERTLIVVTMNQPQKEYIKTLVQAAEKDNESLAAFIARHKDSLEPFDVKNLENVQGDERDVVFVSVTYGPNARGTVSQGFGPVNMVGGERRLNVLFTRAKFRLDVFCSFDPSVLRVTEASPRGLCVLRDYLRFAKEKNLATGRFTAKEPGSDFEIEVARALRGFGYDVHPQVGVAGYFLDLAVVDPALPGRYILAVECDGATYHSAKSARDRDRLRQGVLEGLGWNVHRIWSTDWFRDPTGETFKVIRRIEQALRDEGRDEVVHQHREANLRRVAAREA